MHRLFVAIRPPAAIRAALAALMGGVSGARWQSDEQLHLTLRFIGEVDRHRAEDVAAALGGIHHPRLSLTLDRLGQFDRQGHVETIWVGVGPVEPLAALHNKIDRALERVGIAPDNRTYMPHITLARLGRDAGALTGMLEDRAVPRLSFETDEFILFESHLGHGGASYAPVARYPLA